MPDVWDPARYGRFAEERSAPFYDLVALVEAEPVRRMVDLGCGTGELTLEAHRRLGVLDTVGVDMSAAMLAEAAGRVTTGLRFEQGDMTVFVPSVAPDLIISNAALQWVGDHHAVLARWTGLLAPGGQLAVQVPANADHPSHLVAAEVAAEEPFLSALGGDPPADVVLNVLRPEQYASLLDELGFSRQHVRLQVYGHRLASSAEVVEWVRGTSLNRFAADLDADTFERFVDAYRRRLIDRIGDRSPYFYPFKRILLWGRLG